MAENTVISSILNFKQDGTNSFVTVFPINTTEEVYFDIDNNIKLSEYLKNNSSNKEVNTDADRFALTSDDVKAMDIVKVNNPFAYYLVKDVNNLSSDAGYIKLITGNMLNVPGGIPQLGSDGRLPSDSVSPPVQFITYTSADI